jgi:hypothetical protein
MADKLDTDHSKFDASIHGFQKEIAEARTKTEAGRKEQENTLAVLSIAQD